MLPAPAKLGNKSLRYLRILSYFSIRMKQRHLSLERLRNRANFWPRLLSRFYNNRERLAYSVGGDRSPLQQDLCIGVRAPLSTQPGDTRSIVAEVDVPALTSTFAQFIVLFFWGNGRIGWIVSNSRRGLSWNRGQHEPDNVIGKGQLAVKFITKWSKKRDWWNGEKEREREGERCTVRWSR